MSLTKRSGRKSGAGELARMRDKRGLRQGQVAEALGVDRSMIAHYESGRCLPSFSVFRSMREAYGVTVDELFEAFEAVQRRRARRNGKAA